MPKVPASIIKILKEVPETQLQTVCNKLKITDTLEYKSFIAKNPKVNNPCTTFLETQLTSGNTSTLSKLYRSIEGFLFIGGCAPGIGIAFNLIDACFCFALGNFFGCFMSIISCFPIPGFKVAGKGLEKILTGLLKHISPSKLLNNFHKELHKRLINYLGKGRIGNGEIYHKCLCTIREQLEEMISGLNNPFATEIIRTLGRILNNLPTNGSKITKKIATPKINPHEIKIKSISIFEISNK